MSDQNPPRRLLLIGWDAADWRMINPLLDAGQLPNLSRLVEQGVIGNLATLQPCLSPILWTSIATGKTADQHGITGFVEPIPGGGGVRLASSTSRRTKALWNILSQAGRRSIVVNWFASHPAEPIHGTSVSNRFFEGTPSRPPQAPVPGSVHPATLGEIISELRLHPAELSPADLEPLLPEIRQTELSDDRPRQLADLLARTASVHAVATGALQAEPWDFAAIYYDTLDVAGHHFMSYHPPAMPQVSADDFRRYRHVMNEVYRFHDQLLGRLLELAGDDTYILLVSDHGFHSDHRRPILVDGAESAEAQAAAWHRQYGVLVARGPGLKVDERIYGASLLDIAPTVLQLLGLPVGQDMAGRPLLQLHQNPPAEFPTIPSWDTVAGDDGRHPAAAEQTASESPEVLAQLVALGYLPAESQEATQAAAIARQESKFNLAIVHSSHGRLQSALPLLRELRAERPELPRYTLALAKCLANLQQPQEVLEILEPLLAAGWRSADAELLYAATLFNLKQPKAALETLEAVQRDYPPQASTYQLMGRIFLQQKAWKEAAEALEQARQWDDEDPQCYNSLAMAYLQLQDFESAADNALQAISLLFFFPQAHFHLGLAFRGMGELERAIRSFQLAVTQSPSFLAAHQELANLYEQTNDVPRWLQHQRLARGLPAHPEGT